jgi:isoleucyl-tRNA synthetase
MYTFAPTSHARRSAQTVLWQITEALVRLVAPILTFTADEIWEYLPEVEGRPVSVHLALFPRPQEIYSGDPATLAERSTAEKWQRLFAIRGEVLNAIELERKLGNIGKSLEARVEILVATQDAAILESFGPETLQEFFNVSEVKVREAHGTEAASGAPALPSAIAFVTSGIKCNRCLRYTHDTADYGVWKSVCKRCRSTLAEMGISPPEPGSRQDGAPQPEANQ